MSGNLGAVILAGGEVLLASGGLRAGNIAKHRDPTTRNNAVQNVHSAEVGKLISNELIKRLKTCLS